MNDDQTQRRSLTLIKYCLIPMIAGPIALFGLLVLVQIFLGTPLP